MLDNFLVLILNYYQQTNLKTRLLKPSIFIILLLLSKNTYACNVAPVFTYTTKHTCGLPYIVKAKNTSTGSYKNKAAYWWKVNNILVDSTKGLDSITLLLTRVGSNSIKLYVKDSSGCIDSSAATSISVSSNAKTIIDQSGNSSYNPYWINCIQYIADPDTFSIRVKSNDTLKKFKIFWGDGAKDTTGSDLAPLVVKTHIYSQLGVFTFKIVTINGACVDTIYGTTYNQRQPTAGIVGPASGANRGCVPFQMRIVNASYNISNNTTFDIDWGNGDTETKPASAYADTIYHRYVKGVCNAVLKIKASNACGSSLATWNPVDVSDKDKALWAVTSTCDPTKNYIFQNASDDKYCLLPDIKEYFWDFGDGSTIGWISSKADQNHKYATEGDYYVTLIAKNACGRDTFKSLVRVYYAPKAGFVYDLNRGCKPLTVNVKDTSKGRGYTRIWTITDKNGTSTYTDSLLSYKFNNAGVYTIKLVVKNICSADSVTKTFTINDKPSAKFDSIIGSCIPVTVNYTNTSKSYFINPTFDWDFGDGTGSTLKSPASKVYATAGNYTVRLIVKDSCGNDTFKRIFTAFGLPKAILSGDTVGCTFDSLTFKNQSTNSNQFDWNFGDNTTASNNITGNYKHVYSLAGIFTVRLIAGTGSGCKDTAYHNLTIKPGAKALFTINQSHACTPATFKFVNNSIYGKDFRWYANNKLISTSMNLSDTILKTDSTIVHLKLMATSASSCQGDSMEKIYFTPKNPKALIGNKDSGCGLLKVTFNNISTNTYSNSWNLGNGQNSDNVNPVTFYSSAKKADTIYNVKLNVSNWAGCKDSTKTIIKVFPGPTADFTTDKNNGCGPLSVKFTNVSLTNNSQNVNTLTYKWVFNNGSSSTTINPNTTFGASNTKDSFYAVSLKTTSVNGCYDSISKNIQVYPKPSVQFIADKTSGCQLLKVNFANQSYPKDTGSIAIMSFNWKSGNGAIGNLRNFQGNYKAALTKDTIYKVKLIGYSEHGCVDSNTLDITVHPNPKAQFNLNTLSGCTPLNINSTNLSIAYDGGPLTHSWRYGNGVISFSKNDTLQYQNNTSKDSVFKVWYETTSQFGCKDTVTKNITVRPKPIANFTTSTKKGCAPLSVNLTDASVNPNTYYWGTGNQLGLSAANKTMLLPGLKLFDTFYYISHAVTSIYGCLSDTVYQQVLVLGRPFADFAIAKDSLCAKEYVNILNNSLGGFKYLWKFGDNTTSTSVNPRHKYYIKPTVNRDTIYHLSVEVTSSTGCKDTSKRDVYLVNKPMEPLTLSTSFGCTDLMVTMSHNSKTYKTDYWDFGDNSGRSSSDTVTHIYSNASNMTFSPKVTLRRQRYNCYDTATNLMFVYPKPNAELKASRNNPCDIGYYQFINKSKNFTQNEWTFSDGTVYVSNSFAKVLPSSITVDTFYSVDLVVKNAYGCADTASLTIKVKPKLKIAFSKNQLEACEKGVVDFRNESSNAVRYFWKFGDGGLSTEINPSYVYNHFGIYQIRLFGYDKDGCVDSTSGSNIFKVIERPVADFDFLMKKPMLPNAVVSFVGKPMVTTTNINNLTFNWDFGDASVPDASNSIKDPDHTYVNAGNVEVKFTVYNKQCSDFIIKPIFIQNAKPQVKFAADKYEGCAPLTVKFTNATLNATTYRWIFGDGSPDSDEENPVHLFEFEGKWDVTLIATGAGGSTTISFPGMITVNPTPRADFKVDQRYMSLPNANFFLVNLTNNSIGQKWSLTDSIGNIINTSNMRNPNFTLNTSGRFGVQLIATNSFNCSDTLYKPHYLVTELPGYVYVPTAFTPNNNGTNDGFKPSLTNVSPKNYKFALYTRWGQKVFETEDLNALWDGTFNGQLCEQENYVWKVTGQYDNNDEFTFRGIVALIR